LHTLINWHFHTNSAGKSLNVLINDAENYHAALEENRKLFNQIQELKGDWEESFFFWYIHILHRFLGCLFLKQET
jgi:hypothetical protein